jgi:hypothetical protein
MLTKHPVQKFHWFSAMIRQVWHTVIWQTRLNEIQLHRKQQNTHMATTSTSVDQPHLPRMQRSRFSHACQSQFTPRKMSTYKDALHYRQTYIMHNLVYTKMFQNTNGSIFSSLIWHPKTGYLSTLHHTVYCHEVYPNKGTVFQSTFK